MPQKWNENQTINEKEMQGKKRIKKQFYEERKKKGRMKLKVKGKYMHRKKKDRMKEVKDGKKKDGEKEKPGQ